MASSSRQETLDLIRQAVTRTGGAIPESRREAIKRLLLRAHEEPEAFDFFFLVRCLDALSAPLPRVGRSRRLEEDLIRFAQKPFLHFAPRTIEAVDVSDGELRERVRLYLNAIGLFGPSGPLPLQLTEYARRRLLGQDWMSVMGRPEPGAVSPAAALAGHPGRTPDYSLSGFINIFHHRMISLFYRAWAVNQPVTDLDRADDQRFPQYVGSLFGAGAEGLRRREKEFSEEMEGAQTCADPNRIDWPKLFFAGRLSSQVRNQEGLQAILSYYFDLPIRVLSFFGRWVGLPQANRCRLGRSLATGTLGATVIAGEHVWDCQLSFRIVAGPLTFAEFRRFLPGGPSFDRTRRWVLNYVGFELLWDLQLFLKKEEVPGTILGRQGLLGWTTWLKSRAFTTDPGDLILDGA